MLSNSFFHTQLLRNELKIKQFFCGPLAQVNVYQLKKMLNTSQFRHIGNTKQYYIVLQLGFGLLILLFSCCCFHICIHTHLSSRVHNHTNLLSALHEQENILEDRRNHSHKCMTLSIGISY